MRMTRGQTAVALLILASGCAKIEPPPGGPPDTTPPRLISTSPESLAVLPGFDGEVEFGFSEVISEGGTASFGTGMGTLEQLVVLSPTTRVPEVSWRRDRITVRPREGWEPDRVYRIQLLPGVTDLRNNRETRGGAVVTFTTGAPLPADTLRGQVYDWTTGRPAAGALLEAMLLPDSLTYRSTADSGGAFRFGPLPEGTYLLYASIDQNRNRERGDREAFDSARVATADSGAVELWTFPRDTVGPRIQEISTLDSLSARIAFSMPLDPYQVFDTAAVSLRRVPDSTLADTVDVPIVALVREERFDSLFRRAPVEPADSTAARADSVRPAPADPERPRQPPPTPSRPTLSDRLVLRVAEPLTPGGRYLFSAQGVRNVSGAAADVVGTLAVPAAPVDPVVPADSLAPPPADSLPKSP